MTDTEKLIALKSYIEGVIGNCEYCASFYVEGWRKFLATLDK